MRLARTPLPWTLPLPGRETPAMAETIAQAWRCSVCGYIHRGAEPPEWCPVCGAARDDFEPYEEPAAAPAQAAIARWRCLNCGYVHVGPAPPEECPVCGAPADRFEPIADEGAAAEPTRRPTKAVVVGAGIAGISAVEALRQAAPDAEIVLVSKERALPYYRLNLTRYLAGEIGEAELPIHPQSWYGEHRIELVLGAEATDVSFDGLSVRLRDGRELAFERLILTNGAHPFVPPFPGAHLDGVTSFRTTGHAEQILEAAAAGMACVVIGGGLLGLETAGALARRGARVTLLESHEWLMPRQLNRKAAELLERHVEDAGIALRKQASTEQIVGDERAAGVGLEGGDVVHADLVVVSTGVRSNTYLARRAGLEVNQGVVVDNHLGTSHPAVLAAGDVAEHHGALYGAWGASQYQGSIAGMNAAGRGAEFGGLPRSNTLKVLGLNLLSIGQFEPEDGSYQVLEAEADGAYSRFVFHDGRLVGAILLGDTAVTSPLKHAIETGADFSGLLKQHPTAADVAEHLAHHAR